MITLGVWWTAGTVADWFHYDEVELVTEEPL